jgi:hypothetical protein
MQDTQFASTARQFVAGFDTQAHRAIAGWRTGSERLGQAARERWDRAFADSKAQLSAETRRNASHFRDVVARNYALGVELSATGAERAVSTLVAAAQSALAGRMPR